MSNKRSKLIILILSAIGFQLTNVAYGIVNHQEAIYKQQRAMYKKALISLEKGHKKTFRKQSAQLKDYPLYPYLEYFFILRYISNIPQSEIDRFTQTYADTPLAKRLTNHWHKSLARRKKWRDLISQYEPGRSARLDCYFYWGQYKGGHIETAFKGARNLWNVGKSQEKACDPLFEVWKKSTDFNSDLAWERAKKAMQNRKLQLTRYLERYLKKEHRLVTQEWRRTYRNPKRLNNIQRYEKLGENALPIVISGFKRLVRKDYQLAHTLWPQYEATFAITNKDKAKLFNYFARNMAVNYYPEAEEWLDSALLFPGQEDLVHYGIRHALRHYDWQRVKQWIALLSPAERGSAKWRYWEAKAKQVIDEYQSPLVRFSNPFISGITSITSQGTLAEGKPTEFNVLNIHQDFMKGLSHSDHFFSLLPEYSLKLLENDLTPNELMTSLTTERSFYGFIASEQQNKPLPLNNAISRITEKELQHILQLPGIIRAKELHLLNEDVYAHREWYSAIQSMASELRGAAAHVAHLWGWHNQAIVAAARSDIRNNLELRFPKAYYETVSNHAQTQGLASDWVYSLIRQESAFSPKAKSGVGALGIMQIMPSTARQVSRRAGITLKTKYQLLDPHKNIMIGTAYLGQLLSKFDGNLVLATAAYNAGPHRAKRWQPKNQPMDGDIWIETIPIHETRNYVKNIFTYQAIYRHHLGMEARLSDSLKVIQPKQIRDIATN